jgi:tetratricopeptide (TPR) repeat protein
MDINKAVGICRTSSVARARRGYIHHKLGQLELALEDLNRAIELKPNLCLAYEYRSEVFEAQGKADLAAKDRETIRQLRG